jgi:uncharacterized protein
MTGTLHLPIAQQERTGVVDALRGFALLGVVLANLISFFTFVMPAAIIEQATSGPVNHYYELFFTVFIDNKFITLFSLLFGYGFGVLMERVAAKGIDVTVFYARRMIILLAAGFVHIFFWWGEILHAYAICGLLMMLFRNAGNRALLGWAAFLMLVPSLVVRYLMIKTKAFDPAISEGIYAHYLETALRPDFFSILKANWHLHRYVYVQCLAEWADLLQIMSKLLIGYWVLRRGFLQRLHDHVPHIRRTLLWCAPFAALYVMETAWFFEFHPKVRGLPLRLMLYDLNRIGVLALSLCYGCLLALWYHQRPDAGVLKGFRYVGMMSLSNYLTHTLIYVILLHGIGFGLMGKLTAIETLLVGLAIYIFQVLLSRCWLTRFRYGVAEWVWRQLSYGKRFPLRK